jgi:hypothetical protein
MLARANKRKTDGQKTMAKYAVAAPMLLDPVRLLVPILWSAPLLATLKVIKRDGRKVDSQRATAMQAHLEQAVAMTGAETVLIPLTAMKVMTTIDR